MKLCWEAIEGAPGSCVRGPLIFPIRTWRNFEQQFRVHFFPVNAEADAINALEGTSYHQGGRTVDDYLDNFQALVSDAGYMDP